MAISRWLFSQLSRTLSYIPMYNATVPSSSCFISSHGTWM